MRVISTFFPPSTNIPSRKAARVMRVARKYANAIIITGRFNFVSLDSPAGPICVYDPRDKHARAVRG